VGNLAHGDTTNKFNIANLKLFELIMAYWEQLAFVTLHANHRVSLFVITSIIEALHSLYGFRIERSLFEKPSGDESDSNQGSRGRFAPKGMKSRNTDEAAMANNVIMHTLKAVIIDTTSKLLHENVELKDKYFYQCNFSSSHAARQNSYKNENQRFDWILRCRIYLQNLLNLLDSTQMYDREHQLEVLKFLRLVVWRDLRMQECLINTSDVTRSHLMHSLLNLFMRKALPKKFTKAVLLCLWSMTNEARFFESMDRKCLIYRELGVAKITDTFLDSNDDPVVAEILLEAIWAVSVCSPRREEEGTGSGRLLVIQEEMGSDATPIVSTIFKFFRHWSFSETESHSEETMVRVIEILSVLTVSSGYVCHVKNQLTALKMNCIDSVIKLTKRKNMSFR
jgi:hypothetical protein